MMWERITKWGVVAMGGVSRRHILAILALLILPFCIWYIMADDRSAPLVPERAPSTWEEDEEKN